MAQKASVSADGMPKMTFATWAEAIKHATMLRRMGKISQRELNDIKTEAKSSGHKESD